MGLVFELVLFKQWLSIQLHQWSTALWDLDISKTWAGIRGWSKRNQWSKEFVIQKNQIGCWINNSPLGQSLSPATMFPLDRPVENTSLLRRHLEELSIKFNCSNNGTCHIDSFKRNMSYWVIQKLYFLISSCCSRFLSEYWELTSHMKFM